MMVVAVVNGILVAIAALIIITQVIIPAIQGRAFFPMFKRQSKLESDLAEAKQRQHESKIEAEIERINQEVESKKQPK